MTGATLPRFGRGRIQPLASGNYRPSDDGRWAVVLEVQDRFGELVDLVAWFPDDASDWWLRHSDETPLLGARALAFAADCHEPVTLLPTPEAWLFAHRERPKLDARMTGAEIVQDLKYRRKVKRLVAKGDRVVGEMLAELAADRNLGTVIDELLDRYLAIPDEALDIANGRDFPPPPLHEIPK